MQFTYLPRFIGITAALAIVAATPAQAFCGFYAGKADANLFNEASQVVVARDGKRTVISMLNDYKGPLSEFALVVPTPTTLQKGQVRVAEKSTFERLDAYSSPRLAEYHDADPCRVQFDWGNEMVLKGQMQLRDSIAQMAAAPAAMRSEARAKALGVTIDVQYTLEEYDIVSLSATQSDGLEIWLAENGYKLPKGASAALKPYINQGMKFFVAKVNLKEQLKTGYTTLRPLQFAFESDKFMLPMRLGMLNAAPDKAQDLIVYLLTREGRVESSNYRTVKLPTNVNLPQFIKPKFQDFYKALFAQQAQNEAMHVVFTEYFWDMGWCDPCAANPLTPNELQRAGAFWVQDDQPKAMLTRLHLRYTANTFPEDLMFTQTKDRQNWQTRYVVQNAFDSSPAQCSDKVNQMDCQAMCKPRVSNLLSMPLYGMPSFNPPMFGNNPRPQRPGLQDRDPQVLQRDCVAACSSAKQAGLAAALRYYEADLPKRIASEKQTLAQLTGWGMGEIDALPGATQFTGTAGTSYLSTQSAATAKPWWEQMFKNAAAR